MTHRDYMSCRQDYMRVGPESPWLLDAYSFLTESQASHVLYLADIYMYTLPSTWTLLCRLTGCIQVPVFADSTTYQPKGVEHLS